MQVSRILSVTTAISVCALAAACGTGSESGGSDAGASADKTLSIKFGTPSDTLSSSFYAFVAADRLGYWKDENLEVELVPGSGSGALVEQMVAGNLPAGAPSLPAVIEGLGAGLDLVNIYTYSYGSIFNIRVPEDSEIEAIEDLKGTTIGIAEPGGGENAVLASALKDAGLDPVSDVTTIPIGAGEPTTLDAIESERVDAYASSKNDMFSLQVSGLKTRDLTPTTFDAFPGRAIVTTSKAFEENKEAFTRLMRGIARATLFCDNAPDVCQKFMAEEVPEQWVGAAAGKDSQGSLQLEEAIRTTSVPDGEDFGRHNEQATKEFSDLFAGTIEHYEEFDVSKFLNDDILADVNDFDQDAVAADAEKRK